MKKIMIIAAVAASALMTASCDFLNEKSYMEMEKDKYMNTPEEAESVLLGVYRNLGREASYSYHQSILLNLGTDISQVEGSSTDQFRIVPTNAYPTTQAEIQQTWAQLYNTIYNANDFIERIGVKREQYETAADKDKATVMLAEARALRAMCYFDLVRLWKNIPLVKTTAESYLKPTEFTQANPVDVYKFIEADLKYAVNILPYAKHDTFRADNSYRFSKGAALGLLTKVYATWAGYPLRDESKWDEAVLTAGELVHSGEHDLLSNYEDLWHNTCSGIWDPTESLIEVSMYAPTTTGSTADACGRIGKWNGVRTIAIPGQRGACAGNVKVVHTFVLKWREQGADLRRDLSIANYYYNPEYMLWAGTDSDDADIQKKQKQKQSYTPAKWDLEKYCDDGNKLINSDKSNANWYILRYSDVLLLYAEALNEQQGGPDTEAYEAINKVRRRAGAADIAAGLDYEQFKQAIMDERAYELCFEGHRKQDIIRWGIYYETIKKTQGELADWWNQGGYPNYTVAQYTVEGKHELLPIPQREVDLCKFKQNPLW